MSQSDLQTARELMMQHKTEEAARIYGKILDREPDHPEAAPSYYALQYLLDGDPYWQTRLLQFAAAHPENRTAAQFLPYTPHRGIPYFDHLPAFTEAMINLIRQLNAENVTPPPDQFEIGLSSLESPSARLAAERWLKAAQPTSKLVVTFPPINGHDPRRPLPDVDPHYVVWRYEGDVPVPNVPPPNESISDAVSTIARTGFHLPEWKAAARDTAQTLGGSANMVRSLAALMVNPPPKPEGFTEWDWIFAVQVAAALVIAQSSREWDHPVEKRGLFGRSSTPAPRKAALYALLNGAMDWTTTAAILALTEIALDEPEHDKEIARWFWRRYTIRPQQGAIPYYDALALCGLRLKSISRAERASYQRMIAAE
mgnify:CR=1 FL=1